MRILEEVVSQVRASPKLLGHDPSFIGEGHAGELVRVAAGRVTIEGEDPDPLEVEEVVVELVEGEGHLFSKLPGCHETPLLPGQEPDDPFLVIP